MEKIHQGELPSVGALSFLGDAVCSLYIRRMLVRRGISHAGELNRLSLLYVTAERQTLMYERIASLFTETENDVFRRAYNSGHLNRPKHASIREYRTATGLEAVLGMLYFLNDRERIDFLMAEAVREFTVQAPPSENPLPDGYSLTEEEPEENQTLLPSNQTEPREKALSDVSDENDRIAFSLDIVTDTHT